MLFNRPTILKLFVVLQINHILNAIAITEDAHTLKSLYANDEWKEWKEDMHW